ncbi:transglutaminase family protein [Lignipirellula cremea]|uniref:Protein SirB1 N-terminal domain-containing protein n=1 Tax=Lignipirellula cremea TaxID=2528010 RepID=A0A518DRD6_9BACT|nr:transglutaminase-like domain-containing protein [Lignipirellula cremea]QDU94410.1 hypothetical protein Pla8534_22000 [Lignipirellula cremea]
MKFKPNYCRPEAYFYFAEQLPHLETTTGLLRAALAISMHALDDVVPDDIESRLLGIAADTRSKFRGNQVEAMLAYHHETFFEKYGFAGNHNNYYLTLNSYLPTVLESARGIPVTLSLLYKVIGEYIGLDVRGVNVRGHFLVRVRDQKNWLIIDPYFGGTVLSREEAYTRIEQVTRQRVVRHHSTLEPSTHRQWIIRILANLRLIFTLQNRNEDLGAMNEFYNLLVDEQDR